MRRKEIVEARKAAQLVLSGHTPSYVQSALELASFVLRQHPQDPDPYEDDRPATIEEQARSRGWLPPEERAAMESRLSMGTPTGVLP